MCRHLHTEQTEGGSDHGGGRLYLTEDDGESLKMRKRRQTERGKMGEDKKGEILRGFS